MIKVALIGWLSALSVSAVAQQWSVPEPQNFEQGHVCLEGVEQPITVEFADSMAQQARGLMQRTELGEYSGMLFRYPNQRPGGSGFWMYQTLIPLDIAYLAKDGSIVKTFTMMPCGSDDPRQCRSYAPGEPYYNVLELNAGFLAKHDIRMGDRVHINPPLNENEQCQNN
ncbi:MAG TPA: DUF192 domain-containing protein [Idiomarina baltica]|jgi:uncharacterized membrane protein (UPF0127 family)|uniref:DUF192 domain-containing protein n=1 Tax=Idiomarina baltica TaxID=190892 RepID=A0A348WR34_9GAMM|nr:MULTISPECIES: DUF192 domain-containing protein [Idiomarina]KXS35773.1 MAG: putative conserved secreted protein [Idiomarina sp. T82-3]MAF75579.1 hypothetical protein [Idiomarinaceae bacterium]HAR56996.1 DUF192 domain-containing protein [Idiomarina baltica]|tara:strand:+ start:751 stop:1257 length:507 start_codon:yes stop_codon:yes gene_type:complete